jgi:hypothetical protein
VRLESVKDIGKILEIVPIEVELSKKEGEKNAMPIKEKLEWVMRMLNGEPFVTSIDFKVLMVYSDQDTLVGYAIACLTTSKIKYFNELRLYRVWYDHHYPEAIKMLEEEGMRWAKENKVHVIRTEMDRRVKALARKRKYEAVSVNMERRI